MSIPLCKSTEGLRRQPQGSNQQLYFPVKHLKAFHSALLESAPATHGGTWQHEHHPEPPLNAKEHFMSDLLMACTCNGSSPNRIEHE